MSKDLLLEPDQLVEAIETAFRPLECRVDLYDQGRRLSVRVVDINGDLILPPSFWVASGVRKPHRLRARLTPLRTRVEPEGYTLDPWAFPSQQATAEAH